MEWWLVYLAVGAFAGFVAGLLGVGGGLILVPILVFLFGAQNFPAELVLHLSLGTAMAAIVFTSFSSFRAHHAHQAVRWDVVKFLTPGIVIGTLLGSTFMSWLSGRSAAIVFASFAYYASAQMWLNIKPKPTRGLPGKLGMFGVGGVIGGISSLVAAGGGFLTIPFLTLCNVRMHHAIGTSAAVGFPIAVAGTIGYILNGLAAQQLPEYSLGFVYLPALAWIVAASVLTAPLGAKAAHRTPVGALKKIFAVFLFLLATRMATSLV